MSHTLALRSLAPALALGVIALAGCSPESDASPSGAQPNLSAPAATEEQVVVRDLSFMPDEITVSEGTTVSWVNEDEQGHTITHGEGGAPLDDALFDEPLNAGQAVTYTFEEPGSHPVTCKVHHDMQMTVIVEESGS